jgi:hypothetical protein
VIISMSAAEKITGQYRVQAYKKIVGANNAVSIAPCMRAEADEWWIEQLIGPDRWTMVDSQPTEKQAVRRLAEVTHSAPIETTHYGYSMPRD